MKNRFYVLGTGESIKDYTPEKDIPSIGVNDINKYVPCDYIVCLDPIRLFSEDRITHIKNATPKIFFSFLDEWKEHVKNFQLIKLQSPRGDLKKLDGDGICYSTNSAFAACVLAYKLGGKEIIMYGVDFNSHKAFNGEEKKEKIKKDFTNLQCEFKKRGVKLFVGNNKSYLSTFLPIMKY